MDKRNISVSYDPKKPNFVAIGSNEGKGDPWEDLGLLLEGVGVLVKVCMYSGKIEHNGLPIKKYLKRYVGKVCDDYKSTVTVIIVISGSPLSAFS